MCPEKTARNRKTQFIENVAFSSKNIKYEDTASNATKELFNLFNFYNAIVLLVFNKLFLLSLIRNLGRGVGVQDCN